MKRFHIVGMALGIFLGVNIESWASSEVRKIDCDWNLFQLLDSARTSKEANSPKVGVILRHNFKYSVGSQLGTDVDPQQFAKFILNQFLRKNPSTHGAPTNEVISGFGDGSEAILRFEFRGEFSQLRVSAYTGARDEGVNVVIFHEVKSLTKQVNGAGETEFTPEVWSWAKVPSKRIQKDIFAGLDSRWRISDDFFRDQIVERLRREKDLKLFGNPVRQGPTICGSSGASECYTLIRTEDHVAGDFADIIVVGQAHTEGVLTPDRIIFESESAFDPASYRYFNELGLLIFNQAGLSSLPLRFERYIFGKIWKFSVNPYFVAKNSILRDVSLVDLGHLMNNVLDVVEPLTLDHGKIAFCLHPNGRVYAVHLGSEGGDRDVWNIRSAYQVESKRLSAMLTARMYPSF